ncbi:MAG: 2-oxoacid:acceptor oxidoreductase family protein [Promethearchaeota archaeon]
MNNSNIEDDLIKIVILGRGGQGAVTACEIIAEAAYLSGNFVDVQANPSFGAERRGAPIQAYAKLSRTNKIWDRSEIDNPNVLIVFDENLLDKNMLSSLEKGSIFIINSDKDLDYFIKNYGISEGITVVSGDISHLSLEKNLTIDGFPVINTPILGLLSRALPEITLDNLRTALLNRMGEKLGKLNFELIQEGYDKAKIKN